MNEGLRPRKEQIPTPKNESTESLELRLQTIENNLGASFAESQEGEFGPEQSAELSTLQEEYLKLLESDRVMCEQALAKTCKKFMEVTGVTPQEFVRLHGRGDSSGGLEKQLYDLAREAYIRVHGNTTEMVALLEPIIEPFEKAA